MYSNKCQTHVIVYLLFPLFWSKQLSGRVTLPSLQSQCHLCTTAHNWCVDHYIVSLPVSCATACVLARAPDAAWSVLVFLSILCLWLSSISYKCICTNTTFMYAHTHTHGHMHATHIFTHRQCYTCTHICMHARTHVRMHMHTHTHAHAHTHTHTYCLQSNITFVFSLRVSARSFLLLFLSDRFNNISSVISLLLRAAWRTPHNIRSSPCTNYSTHVVTSWLQSTHDITTNRPSCNLIRIYSLNFHPTCI